MSRDAQVRQFTDLKAERASCSTSVHADVVINQDNSCHNVVQADKWTAVQVALASRRASFLEQNFNRTLKVVLLNGLIS